MSIIKGYLQQSELAFAAYGRLFTGMLDDDYIESQILSLTVVL